MSNDLDIFENMDARTIWYGYQFKNKQWQNRNAETVKKFEKFSFRNNYGIRYFL